MIKVKQIARLSVILQVAGAGHRLQGSGHSAHRWERAAVCDELRTRYSLNYGCIILDGNLQHRMDSFIKQTWEMACLFWSRLLVVPGYKKQYIYNLLVFFYFI